MAKSNNKLIFILKKIGQMILIFFSSLVLYILAAYFLPKITVKDEINTKDEIAIYIKTNGVHTDIVVPTKNEIIDWSQDFKFNNTDIADSTFQYLAIGWGDKGFYLETPTWAELKFSTAFKAAFGLNTTALHTTYYQKMDENEACKKIMISNSQYQRLIDYIFGSLDRDAQNQAIFIETNANYTKTDAFYEATGRYSLFHTCNTWANKALKASGQRACWWTPTDKGIFDKY